MLRAARRITSAISFGMCFAAITSCAARWVRANLAALMCTMRVSTLPASMFSRVRSARPISLANAFCVYGTVSRRRRSRLSVIECHPFLCYIMGNRRGCSPSGPQLSVNGNCQFPLTEPDLEVELDAHGCLQSGCRSTIASVNSLCHHFGGCASENHHFGGYFSVGSRVRRAALFFVGEEMASRYYIHGDRHEDGVRWYCARCDEFVGRDHFYREEVHAKQAQDYKKFKASLARVDAFLDRSRGAYHRPEGAENIFAWALGTTETDS